MVSQEHLPIMILVCALKSVVLQPLIRVGYACQNVIMVNLCNTKSLPGNQNVFYSATLGFTKKIASAK